MHRNDVMTRLCIWVNRFAMALVAILVPAMPLILRWYSTVRSLMDGEYYALLIAFYCCAVVTVLALLRMDGLLRAIAHQEVFTHENVSRIRFIRWCCALISLICLPAAFFYLPLVFMVVIMAFLGLMITVLVRVMAAAVAIREENDLTI